MTRLPIACAGAELSVDCAQIAGELHLPVDPWASEAPLAAAIERLAEDRDSPSAIVLAHTPHPKELVPLMRRTPGRTFLAVLPRDEDARLCIDLARDTGIVAVDDLRPLLAALALARAEAREPWRASLRSLPGPDRIRLEDAFATSERREGRFARDEGGRLAYLATDTSEPQLVGEPRDVAEAVLALEHATGAQLPPMPSVEGVDPQTVRDVIFGPARALSDPASKSALAPYDVPLPSEELCTSASRAASEASRIGFPVRIALASPDLRVWDHPDLAADGVDSAAGVRDVFRQIMALARARAPEARLLGVTVAATTAPQALLRVLVTALPDGLASVEVSFADGHGVAAQDRTRSILPLPASRLVRVLERLRGADLILPGGRTERREAAAQLGDVLLRLGAFVHEWPAEVHSVSVQPLAVLVGGALEIREACVTVSDAFERSLDARPLHGRADR